MKLYGRLEQDSIFTDYALFHLMFGFWWYAIYHFLRKLDLIKGSVATSFAVMVIFHLLFEIIETLGTVIKIYQKLGWQDYGGDHVLNAMADSLCNILGFWLGYFVLQGASPKERY
jgi:hypothetical protein